MSYFSTTSKIFSDVWTFSRALATLQPDSSGLFETVETGLPRLSASGLAIESGSTNLILHCRDLTNAAWDDYFTISTARNAVGITGEANTATTLTDSDTSVAARLEQIVTVPATATYNVASLFIGKTSGASTFPRVDFEYSGGRSSEWIINTDTGQATRYYLNPSTQGTAAVSDFGDFWRVEIALDNAQSNSSAKIQIYPAAVSSGSIQTFSGTLTGSCIVDAVQIEEAQTAATSPIITTTTTVTRPSESAVNALFSTWGRQQVFTLFVEIDDFGMTPAGGDILALYKTGTDRIRISSDTGSGGRFALISAMDTGGNKTRYFTATSSAKIAISCAGENGGAVIKAVNGSSASDTLTSAAYSDITSIGIGRGQSTTNPPQSVTIKRIEFWPKAMTAAELEALTA